MKLTFLPLLFAVSHGFAPIQHRGISRKVSLRMSSEDEVAKLRAAAAKAREEADKMARELGRTVPTKTETVAPVKKEKSPEELAAILSTLDYKDVAQLEALKSSGDLTMWKSVNLRTYPVSLDMLEQRTKLSGESFGVTAEEVSLDDFKYATLAVALGSGAAGVASLAFLPPNIGSTLCYLFALIPVVFLGIGSSAPGIIANAIASIKGGNGETEEETFRRICRHEAAHLCCGYLCGLSVQDYQTEGAVPRVEFGSSPDAYSTEELAQLVVTAMGGSVGEAMEYGYAKGGTTDLIDLESIFRRSNNFIGAQQQQELTRWGALTAFNLLAGNKDKYEKVVDAFAQKKSVTDCIAILES